MQGEERGAGGGKRKERGRREEERGEEEGRGEVLIIITTLVPTNLLDEFPSIFVFGARKRTKIQNRISI